MNLQDPTPFPQLRTAYLRSIAKAWRNPLYQEKFPRSEVTLYLPMPPEDPDCKPVALAAYNATGGQYPFTCT